MTVLLVLHYILNNGKLYILSLPRIATANLFLLEKDSFNDKLQVVIKVWSDMFWRMAIGNITNKGGFTSISPSIILLRGQFPYSYSFQILLACKGSLCRCQRNRGHQFLVCDGADPWPLADWATPRWVAGVNGAAIET